MNIAVIFGGESTEHDVSILTGLSVMKNLSGKYAIIPIYISREGNWLTGEKLKKNSTFEGEVRGYGCYFELNSPFLRVKHGFKTKIKIDCAVLCLHGGLGEGGGVQGLLELAKIPYTSCGIMSSSVCMDKMLTKAICKAVSIPKLDYVCGNLGNIKGKLSESELDYPLMVKPARQGSSIGITRVNSEEEFDVAIELASQFDDKILIEPALVGFRELSIAAMVCDTIEYSEVEEVVCGEFYSFDNKYSSHKPKRQVPADVGSDIHAKICDIVAKFCGVCDIFGCVRFDFLLKDELYLNEVNTIPGNMAFYLWKNYSYTKLLSKLIDGAIERFNKSSTHIKTMHTTLLKNLDTITKITKK